MVNKKSKRKIGRPAKYDWGELEIMMIALGKAGYKTAYHLSKILDIPKSTIERYIDSHYEFAEKLKRSDTKIYAFTFQKLLEQVKRGYFPAIQYLLERYFKGFDNLINEEKAAGIKIVNIVFGVKKDENNRKEDK